MRNNMSYTKRYGQKKEPLLLLLSAAGHIQGWRTDHQHFGFLTADIRPAMGQIAFEVQGISRHQTILFAIDGEGHYPSQAVLKLFPLVPHMTTFASGGHAHQEGADFLIRQALR